MTPREIAETAIKIIDSKKGKDVALLETTELTMIADYFIICTGTSVTHLKTMSDEVEKVLREAGEPPHHVEGYRSGSWILMDFGCLIIHLFLEDARKFYSLERLWNDAKRIDISGLISE